MKDVSQIDLDHLRTWIGQRGHSQGTFTRIQRLQAVYGDLVVLYRADGLQNLLAELTYTTGDERERRPNPTKLSIDGNLRNGLASIKSAAAHLCDFLTETVGRPDNKAFPEGNLRPRRQAAQTRTPNASGWPEWNMPSEEEELRLAHIAIPYVRFLHPEIVLAVVEDNGRHRARWSDALYARGINPDLYLWERTSCAFPGIRRHAGSNEIAQHRGKAQSSAIPTDALCLDDNSFPKQIWSFIFRANRFQNHGPKGYALAHLADHKLHKNRSSSEFTAINC